MPFLRLIIIYIVVIGIAFAIFNRDKVMQLAGFTAAAPISEVEESSEAEPSDETKVEPVVAVQETEATAAPVQETETEKLTAETPKAAEQASETLGEPAQNLVERLNEARKAFQSGDMKTAEASYVALAEEFSQNANIQGEVGNFFYSQRRGEEAANYFHKAGLLLIKTGNRQQVMAVINALQGLSPEKAADLRAKAAQ